MEWFELILESASTSPSSRQTPPSPPPITMAIFLTSLRSEKLEKSQSGFTNFSLSDLQPNLGGNLTLKLPNAGQPKQNHVYHYHHQPFDFMKISP